MVFGRAWAGSHDGCHIRSGERLFGSYACEVTVRVPFHGVLPPPRGFPFEREFAASYRLLQAVKRHMDDRPADRREPADTIVYLETIRACNIYESILALCVDGYGPSAEMLLRPMWDAVTTTAWAHAHPVETDERYALHRKYLLRLYWAARAESGLYSDLGEPDELSPEEQRQAQELFGQYGQRSWTGVSMRQMATEFVESIDHGASRKHMEVHAAVVQPFVNWMLHSSGLGFWRLVAPSEDLPDGMNALWVGPSERGVRDALDMGWNQFVMVLGVYEDHFGEDLSDQLKPLIYDVWASFKDPEVMRSLGRNDACPCRSGEKFKNCHGALKQ